MKRILIVNNNMHIGGVQKSLLNLLSEIHGEYDITLLLFCRRGELLNEIPGDVKVISPTSPFRYLGMTKDDAAGFPERLLRDFWAGTTRVFGRGFVTGIMRIFQKKLRGFDTAISFLHSGPSRMFYGGCNEFVLRCVEANRKITFLHCDYEKIKAASKYNAGIYRQFDTIAACSAGCARVFLNVLPQFAGKTVVVPNCQNYAAIRQLAHRKPVCLNPDRLNVVTVSRLGKEKGIPRAIQAVASLGGQIHAVRYYIIGDGADYAEAAEMISDLGLTDTVFLLGAQGNPYGYMAAADLLLIPSVSEAAPMVIGEAASLGVPILTTETSSAKEMVSQTGYGWVCENSVEGITSGMEMLLAAPEMLQAQKRQMKNMRFDNAHAIRCFSELVN